MARARKAKRGTESSTMEALQARLGYTFANAERLRLALTHRSFSYEARGIEERTGTALPGDDNEQLEFLGDAVLGLIVAEALCQRFADRTEGELTRLRASLVGRKRMSAVGLQLELGSHMLLGATLELNGGRTSAALMGNAVEAIIAAVYLDGGLEAARALVERLVVEPEMAAMREALEGSKGGAMRDHKTLLQERVQATHAGRLRYIDTGDRGPLHPLRFRVEAHLESEAGDRLLATAEGPSKKEAQQRAAEQALAGWVDAGAEGTA